MKSFLVLALLAAVTLAAPRRHHKSGNAKSAPAVENASSKFTLTTIDDQADLTFNQLLGISSTQNVLNNGQFVIAGYFGSGVTGHPNQGYFIPNANAPSFTNLNVPNSVQTQDTCIDPQASLIGGFSIDKGGRATGWIWNTQQQSFILKNYRHPNAGAGANDVTQILGVLRSKFGNNIGTAVGFYTDDKGVNHGFVYYISSGTAAAVNTPDAAGCVSTTVTGITSNGDIVGFCTTAAGTTVSFLNNMVLQAPGSTNTQALGANANGEVVGAFTDAAGVMHGFSATDAKNHAVFVIIDHPQGTGGTTLNGINDMGVKVGFYVDANGNTNGLLVTPKAAKQSKTNNFVKAKHAFRPMPEDY
ncbi:hypothetical protein BC830DRAFT_1141633 [Chytriomyces sp. MP71]|nr:hypothetical protein BC830DRAFT_1141633 [Chytriomyces sp. MP71]